MKATITTFKQSGKWYDTFDVELPIHFKSFETQEIREYLINTKSQCDHMNFTFAIDGLQQLVIHL